MPTTAASCLAAWKHDEASRTDVRLVYEHLCALGKHGWHTYDEIKDDGATPALNGALFDVLVCMSKVGLVVRRQQAQFHMFPQHEPEQFEFRIHPRAFEACPQAIRIVFGPDLFRVVQDTHNVRRCAATPSSWAFCPKGQTHGSIGSVESNSLHNKGPNGALFRDTPTLVHRCVLELGAPGGGAPCGARDVSLDAEANFTPMALAQHRQRLNQLRDVSAPACRLRVVPTPVANEQSACAALSRGSEDDIRQALGPEQGGCPVEC